MQTSKAGEDKYFVCYLSLTCTHLFTLTSPYNKQIYYNTKIPKPFNDSDYKSANCYNFNNNNILLF